MFLIALLYGCKGQSWEGRFEKERKLRRAFRSMEAIELLYGEQLQFWHVSEGETVVEMGAYDGVMAGLISMYSENATIYIQDIDTGNFHVFRNNIKPYFEELSGGPFTNKFKYVKGDYDTTNLPANTFNKVLVNNVLEWVIAGDDASEEENTEAKKDFLREMHLILKDTGYLYVRIPIARNESEEEFLFSENSLVNLVTQQKFILLGDLKVLQGMYYIFKFQKSDRNGRIRY